MGSSKEGSAAVAANSTIVHIVLIAFGCYKRDWLKHSLGLNLFVSKNYKSIHKVTNDDLIPFTPQTGHIVSSLVSSMAVVFGEIQMELFFYSSFDFSRSFTISQKTNTLFVDNKGYQ